VLLCLSVCRVVFRGAALSLELAWSGACGWGGWGGVGGGGGGWCGGGGGGGSIVREKGERVRRVEKGKMPNHKAAGLPQPQ